MIRKVMCVKQGDLSDEENRAGVRADIVVKKRGNARGAKGGRKVDTERKANGNKPSSVTERTKQGGETYVSAQRAMRRGESEPKGRNEPDVWTDRMLTALSFTTI